MGSRKMDIPSSEKVCTMTEAEIEAIIRRELKYIEKRRNKLVEIKTDIDCSERAVRFWKDQLKKIRR